MVGIMADVAGMIRARLKLRVRRLRNRIESTLYGFGPGDLRRDLAGLGIGAGDVLFVHSSFGAFRGFTGTAVDVITLLQELVGPGGTVLMPSQPTAGSSIDYLESGSICDVRTTPTRMGLIAEFFRRTPGVSRSLHPTHPVTGWGRRAEELLAGHETANTPCGTGSPYMKLIEAGGKIVHLGSGFQCTTFLHATEEFTLDRMPVSPWTEETYVGRVRDGEGRVLEVPTRLYRKDVAAVRQTANLVPELGRGGHYRRRKLKRLELLVVDAKGLAETAVALAGRGIFHYDFGALSPASQVSTVPPQE
jgi:aminoglycoside N3'-acetyltransferase